MGPRGWWKNSKRVMGTEAVVFQTAVWWRWKIEGWRRVVLSSQHPACPAQISSGARSSFSGPGLPPCWVLGFAPSLVMGSASWWCPSLWGVWHTRGFGDLCLHPSFGLCSLARFLPILSLKYYICKILDNHTHCAEL